VGSDPKDRHVLVAAIVGGCQVIVTFNTKACAQLLATVRIGVILKWLPTPQEVTPDDELLR
jgi:hypothetical protein